MSLPLILGTTAAGGVLLGLMFLKRKTIRRSVFPSAYEKRARNEIKDMAEQRKIGQSIMRQNSQHSDISDDVFKSSSNSARSEHLRESLLGKGRKTKRRTRRHHK